MPHSPGKQWVLPRTDHNGCCHAALLCARHTPRTHTLLSRPAYCHPQQAAILRPLLLSFPLSKHVCLTCLGALLHDCRLCSAPPLHASRLAAAAARVDTLTLLTVQWTFASWAGHPGKPGSAQHGGQCCRTQPSTAVAGMQCSMAQESTHMHTSVTKGVNTHIHIIPVVPLNGPHIRHRPARTKFSRSPHMAEVGPAPNLCCWPLLLCRGCLLLVSHQGNVFTGHSSSGSWARPPRKPE